jgi:protease I
MPKALLIIAPNNFRDEELFDTKSKLEESGIETEIAGITTNEAKGMLGGTAKPDITLYDVVVDNYDAVIFIGGSGSSVYFNDKKALAIAKQSYESGKITAAICIAPSILANAGILEGKKATAYSSEAGNREAKGAIYTGKAVEQDGKVITASGPQAARQFAETISKGL